MSNDKLLASAQIGIAGFYAAALVAVILLLLFSPPSANTTVLDLLKTALGALIVLCTQQSTYFFARQRGDKLPSGETDAPTPAPVIPTTPDDT